MYVSWYNILHMRKICNWLRDTFYVSIIISYIRTCSSHINDDNLIENISRALLVTQIDITRTQRK